MTTVLVLNVLLLVAEKRLEGMTNIVLNVLLLVAEKRFRGDGQETSPNIAYIPITRYSSINK